MVQNTVVEANRDAIDTVLVVVDALSAGDGGVLVAIDRFALTSNNITYAAHGADMGYWRFFPATDPARGVVPVWGFGTVVESMVDGVAPGDRFYGYWPMASHARLEPVKVTPRGFVDGAAHRAGLPGVYNGYSRITPGHVADERVWVLFRPLYLTSFVLGLDVAARPGIARVVLASASSKTALGLAQTLQGQGLEVIGLTSPGNLGFVEGTGYFDAVASYDRVGELAGKSTVFVDFSGNGAVRHAVHERLGGDLTASLIVGDTHWRADNAGALPGPAPELFFAPTVIAARLGEWGQAGFDARVKTAWDAFTASTNRWLKIVEAHGAAAAAEHYAALAAGRIDPAQGIVVSLR